MNKAMSAKFSILDASPIMAFTEYDSYAYVGGGNGIVYRTIDGFSYEEFWRLDGPITSMSVYASALFVSISLPSCKIMMHNFSTGNRFEYVNCNDNSVSSMITFNNTLYAATSPSGMVLSFNGEIWEKQYESFYDVSTMSVFNDFLYVFFRDSFAVLKYSSGTWSFMNDVDSPFSVAGKIGVKTSISQLSSPSVYDTGIVSSATMGGKLYFCGNVKSSVYSYDGSSVSVEYQFGRTPISSLSASETQVFAAVGDLVYVAGGSE